MAGSSVWDSLSHPAFPAELDERDRHVGWAALTVVAGTAAGIVGAIIVAILVLAIFFGLMAAGGVLTEAQAVLRRLGEMTTRAETPTNLRDTATALVLLASVNTPAFILPVLAAALIGRRRFLAYLNRFSRFRWSLLAWGMGLMSVSLLPLFVIGEIIEPTSTGVPIMLQTHDLAGRLLFLLVAVGCLLPAAAAEEVLFRGWLLRQSMAFLRNPWAAMAVNGVLFAAMHMNPNLDDSFQLAMMGVAFCYMALRFGGIEFAIGAHAINNILIVLFFQALPLAGAERHPFSITVFLSAFLVPAACLATTELVLRWQPLRNLVSVDVSSMPRVATDETARDFD